jgi:hypothetical protein
MRDIAMPQPRPDPDSSTGDQPFWAEQLRQRGVAPAAPSGRHITADSLSRAIDAAQTAKMRSENGLPTAVERIQALVAR